MDVDNRTADVAAKPLRLLVVEDSPQDAEIVVREIRRGGFDVTWKRVETAETLRAALDAEPWDAVVADYRMPNFDGLAALRVLQEKRLDIPFIIVSGTIGEETAVAVMKAGAHDYLMKDRLARLAPTIDRELRDAAVRREKRRLEEGMREAARQWRTTFDAMNDAVCLIDKDLRIVRCNRLFCNLVGKPWGNILGQTYYSIVHGCAAPIADCPVVRARESRHHESLLMEMKGRWWALAADPVLDDAGQLTGLVQVLVDVTEQRAAEAALRKSEEKFRLLSESAIIGIYIIQDAKIAYANPNIAKMFGYSQEEVTGNLTLMDAIHPEDRLTVMRNSQERLEGKTEKGGLVYRGIKKDGSIIYIEAYSVLVDYEGRQALMGTLIDVTERKQAEEKLRFFALAVERSSDAIGMSTPDGKHYYQNKAFDDMFGVVGENPPATLYVDEQVGREVFRAIIGGDSWTGEVKMRGKAGELLDVFLRAYAIKDDIERIIGLAGVHTDITERKQAEAELRESEIRYRTLFQASSDGILIADLETKNFRYANPAACRLLGYSVTELSTMDVAAIHPKTDLPRVMAEFEAQACGDKTLAADLPCLRKDGTIVYADVIAGLMTIDDRACNVGFFRDNTERKQAAEKLLNLMQHQELILSSTAEGILGLDSQGNHTFINTAAAKMLGYEAEELLDRPSHSIWHHTRPDGSPFPKEECGISATYREGAVYRNSTDVFWRKDGTCLPVEYASTPINEQGRLAGAVVTFIDITDRKRAENDLKQSFNSLQDSLTGAVQAMATVVESRDPYTAGHQRRVAELAHAIASEMRLPINQIDGLRMAAVIHDLGKIAVPAEILSKPTKLKKSEFELIQDHPQAGYEILKDIVFPWPIARIVLEHHEKMDGSGYPNGSVGENILLESKILTVADVVEAMASHRPYRPALGIDAALKEIEKNKGTHYDVTVVEACLSLFREKGFQLEGT
jgi:PAS domain S-box-containing protein